MDAYAQICSCIRIDDVVVWTENTLIGKVFVISTLIWLSRIAINIWDLEIIQLLLSNCKASLHKVPTNLSSAWWLGHAANITVNWPVQWRWTIDQNWKINVWSLKWTLALELEEFIALFATLLSDKEEETKCTSFGILARSSSANIVL